MIRIPSVILDDWLAQIPPLWFKIAVYLASRGFDVKPGYPIADRWRLADALGADRGGTYRALKSMETVSLLRRVGECYVLNLVWAPKTAPWKLVEHTNGREEPQTGNERKTTSRGATAA